MKIETYTDLSGFDALAEEWNDLLKRSAFDTLFLTWEWQRTWWEHLGEGDLFLIAMRDDQGRMAGIAPLYPHGHLSSGLSCSSRADWITCPYCSATYQIVEQPKW